MDPNHQQPRKNPFPGLRPFEAHENHLFFGRDGQSNELLAKLRKTHFVAVVGTSGSGKSSLVRAGLLPDLYSGMMSGSSSRWRIAVFRPGGNPMHNLALALGQSGVLIEEGIDREDSKMQQEFLHITLNRSALGLVECWRQANLSEHENLLVVVDQFEEVFRFLTSSGDQGARDKAAAFVKVLLTSVEDLNLPIYIVITMRSDYLGDCSRFRDLPEAINQGQYLIPRMTRNQRREAISGPIAVGGATIQPQLIQKLLNDVGSNPDQLPVLQHALMRTWSHWSRQGDLDRAIEISDYQAIGGLDHALSIHADKAYAEIAEGFSKKEADRRRLTTEKLFKFLTEKGADNREIRRQARLKDIAAHTETDIEELISIIEVFRSPRYSFLVPPHIELSQDTVIDISHESLIRQWMTLRKWVDEEAESSKIFARLVESAQLHRSNKKDLLFGLELDQFIEWKEQFKPDLAWAKRYSEDCTVCLKYLEDSQKQREELVKQQEAEKLEAELRRKKELTRTRVFAAVLAFATLISLGFLIYANYQKELALIQRDNAQANYQISQAQLQAETDPTYALRLAEQALKIRRSPLVLNAAHKIYRENLFYKILPHQSEVHAVSFSPVDNLVLTGGTDGIARIWDGDKVWLEIDVGQEIISSTFSPDGNLLLIAGNQGSVFLYDKSGGKIRELAHQQPVSSAAFSPKGDLILTGSEQARLWDMNGNLVQSFGQDQISSVAFSPDGRSVLTAYYDKHVDLWDLAGRSLHRFGDPDDYIYSVAFDPQGNLILTGSVDGIAKIWTIEGFLVEGFDFHTNRISSVAFSPNGDKILTGSFDNTIGMWDLNEDRYSELKGHRNRIYSVAFSNDGSKVLSGSDDATARLWEIQGQLIDEFEAHDEYILAVDYSPDGTKLLTGSYDNTAKLWDLSGALLTTITGHLQQVNSVVFSPDGTSILTGSEDGTALLTDLDGQVQQHFDGGAPISAVTFSPDGSRVLIGSADGIARSWNLNGDPLVEYGSHSDRISSVAFAPDGSLVLTASWDSLARIWDEGGELITELKGQDSQVYAAVFSADGSQVLTGSGDGAVRIWDLKGNLVTEINTSGIVSCIEVAPDNDRIISVNLGSSVMLWDQDGNLLRNYSGQVVSAAFSPDGRKILAGSGDNAQIWSEVIKLDQFLSSDKIGQMDPDSASIIPY